MSTKKSFDGYRHGFLRRPGDLGAALGYAVYSTACPVQAVSPTLT